MGTATGSSDTTAAYQRGRSSAAALAVPLASRWSRQLRGYHGTNCERRVFLPARSQTMPEAPSRSSYGVTANQMASSLRDDLRRGLMYKLHRRRRQFDHQQLFWWHRHRKEQGHAVGAAAQITTTDPSAALLYVPPNSGRRRRDGSMQGSISATALDGNTGAIDAILLFEGTGIAPTIALIEHLGAAIDGQRHVRARGAARRPSTSRSSPDLRDQAFIAPEGQPVGLDPTGNSTRAGPVEIDGGTLLVSGDISPATAAIAVERRAGGTGTVGNVAVDGGTLAPGQSIGTLNVTGSLPRSRRLRPT